MADPRGATHTGISAHLPVFRSTAALRSTRGVVAAMADEGTARALVIPNHGVSDPTVAFSFTSAVG
jgi:hypothetical protein